MAKKQILNLIILFCALFILGCTNTSSQTTVYEVSEPESILVKTPEGEVNDFVIFSAIHIISGKADIYIEDSVSLSDKTKIIETIFEMIDYLPLAKGTSYVVSDKIGNWIDNNIVYLNASEFYENNNFLCFTLLKSYGTRSNYGLVYGYSQYLLNISNTISSQEVHELTENKEYIFDLTWPLFLSEYVSIEVIEASKSIATMFVGDLISTQGNDVFITLLQESSTFSEFFDTNLSVYLKQWLLAQGIDYEFTRTNVIIRYSKVSSQYPVMAETVRTKYYFSQGYIGTGIYGVTLLDYVEVKDYISTLESEMSEVRTFVNNDLSVETYGKIPIYHNLRDMESDSFGGIYIGSKEHSEIIVYSIGATLHEYVHYATIGTIYSDISAETKAYLSEGIAVYITSLYDKYWIDTSYSEYQICLETDPDNLKTFITNFEGYLERNSLDFNMLDYIDCYAYTFGKESTYPNYITSTSFIRYLLDNYGDELFWDYFGDVDTFVNIYGQNHSTVMDEWYASIITKYQDN